MRTTSLILLMVIMLGCQDQQMIRKEQNNKEPPQVSPLQSVQPQSDSFVILPKGSKLEMADYSAVWGVQTRRPDLAESERDRPVVISGVNPDLPAGLSGVVEGATILKFNGRQLRNESDLYNAIRELPFESIDIPFTMKLPDGEIREGTTFVIHVEITGLKHFFEQLKARSRK